MVWQHLWLGRRVVVSTNTSECMLSIILSDICLTFDIFFALTLQAVATSDPQTRLLANTDPKKQAKAPVDQYCSGAGERIPCSTNNEKKLYVCHHEGQDKSRPICIAEEALSGHMRNHRVDSCGLCDSQASCDGSSPVDLAALPQECDSSNAITVKVNGSVKVFEETETTGNFRGEDSNDGSTFQYIRNENNQIVGTLVDFTEHTVSQFYLDADGNQLVKVTKSSDFPPELDPVEVVDETNQRMLKDTHFGAASSSTKRMLQGINLIDVLVVWTANAECRNSGLNAGCIRTAQTYMNMMDKVHLANVETNDALSLSGSNTRILVVHSEYIDYTEHKVGATSLALSELRDPTDGIIDDVHNLRFQHGADMVAMIIDDGQSCGVAYLNNLGPRSHLMFSVTALDCATGYYSFGHGKLGSIHYFHLKFHIFLTFVYHSYCL